MPLQNRVTPDGRIIADAARGTMMGNRGVLHDEHKELGPARWRHKNWVACRLEFNGRHRQVMTPRRYTELFFLDEAVAFAAGHRPCGECRRADYLTFKKLWERDVAGTAVSAKELDTWLHAERAIPRQGRQRYHAGELADLPSGAFVLLGGEGTQPFLVWQDRLFPYLPAGYEAPMMRPLKGEVKVLTPPSTLKVFEAGLTPAVNLPAAYRA